MERPEKVHLDEVVVYLGIKVYHTHEGLKYMIDHYTHILSLPTSPKVRSHEVTEHMKSLIENWQQHLILYETKKI